MDLIATVLLSLLGLAAAAAVLFTSPFLVMATDSADGKPRMSALGSAFAVTWGGAAVGVIGPGIGIFRAARHGTAMWIWPAMGIALIGACFTLGAWLASKAGSAPAGSRKVN
ncbi:MAG: hypothetical protein KIH64_004475 [Mycobacterium sp.]|nr:hypothetical protein [Mycobacterium sp.]